MSGFTLYEIEHADLMLAAACAAARIHVLRSRSEAPGVVSI